MLKQDLAPNLFRGGSTTEADGVRAADDPEQFASAIIALLEDPALREEASVRARESVRLRHCWEGLGAQLEQVAMDMAMVTGRET